jgi:hypothetical protein
MVRRGREAVVGSLEATASPEKRESDNPPQVERRLNQRHPARDNAVAEIRRWSVGSAADLAVRLVDLSKSGVRVQLKQLVQTGERFEVTLWSPNRGWSIRCMGVVRWCKAGPDGLIMAGLRLSRPISAQDFVELIAE